MSEDQSTLKTSWLVKTPNAVLPRLIIKIVTVIGLLVVGFLHIRVIFEYGSWLQDIAYAEVGYAIAAFLLFGRLLFLSEQAGEHDSYSYIRFGRITALYGWFIISIFLLPSFRSSFSELRTFVGDINNHVSEMLFLYGWLLVIYFGAIKPKLSEKTGQQLNSKDEHTDVE